MKIFLVCAAILSAVVSVAQAPSDRMSTIWNSARDRFNTQNDYWFQAGEYLRCINMLKAMADLYPDDYELYTDLGWMQENVEEWDAALATYQRFHKAHPNDPDAAFPEGNFYFMRKRYKESVAVLAPSIAGKNVHPNSFRILARAYEKSGDLEGSKKTYEALIRRYPKDEPAKVNLKRILAKMAKPPAK